MAAKAKREKDRVVRISAESWRRLEKIRGRISSQQSSLGIDPPSMASVIRSALDLGIHSLGRRVSVEAQQTDKKEKESSDS